MKTPRKPAANMFGNMSVPKLPALNISESRLSDETNHSASSSTSPQKLNTNTVSKARAASRVIIEISDDEAISTNKQKCEVTRPVKRELQDDDNIIVLSDSDVPRKHQRWRVQKSKALLELDNVIKITRQTTVHRIIQLMALPECWSVPIDYEDTAYLLDLTADGREWLDSKGDPLFISAIIKLQVSMPFTY